MSEILLPMCSRIFIILSLTFKSVIHFEFILVRESGLVSFFLACVCPIFTSPFIE